MSINAVKIASNTFFLYIRTIFLILITLYVTRVLLRNLGEVSFGVYSLVVSVTMLFAFMRGLLATATQRFLNFARGKFGGEAVVKVFTVSIYIHVTLAVIFIVLVEIIGVYLLNTKVNIPEDLTFAANILMQCTIFTVAFNIVTIPFDSVIISHESFKSYAYFAILDEGLKLVSAIALGFMGGSHLIEYGVLVLISAILVLIIRLLFCRCRFEECRRLVKYDKSLCKQMGKFIGWNFCGFSTLTLYNEGINILLNVYGGVVVNGAKAVANQVLQGISSFSTKLVAAVSPQAVSEYAKGQHQTFFELICFSAKTIALLYIAVATFIYAFLPQILKIWLGDAILPHTVEFIKILLIYGLGLSYHTPLDTCFKAYGDLSKYQIIDAILNISILIMAAIFLNCGLDVESALWAMVIGTAIKVIASMVLAHIQVGLPIKKYMIQVMASSMAVAGLLLVCVYVMQEALCLQILWQLMMLTVMIGISTIFVGMNRSERTRLLRRVMRR